MGNPIILKGMRVKAARKYRGIPQYILAEKAGISQSNLSFIEANRHNTNIDTVKLLAQVLEVTVDWLLGNSMEGGVPTEDYQNLTQAEREKLSERFIACYERLKTLG